MIFERREHGSEGDVDPDVDVAELSLDAVRGRKDGGGAGNIHWHDQWCPAAAPDILGGTGEAFLSPGQQRYARAAGGVFPRDRAADATARTRDNDDLI